jgi:type IV pilus assembly protein PilA
VVVAQPGSGSGLKRDLSATEYLGVSALQASPVRGEERRNIFISHRWRTVMLARLTKSMRNKDKGFTLIELLVVIIIIGILAAIAIPIFLNQRKKGVDASIKSDVKNMATQVETYYTDSQAFPTAVAAVTGGYTVGTEKVPTSSGNVLTYTVAGNHYVICGSNTNGTATGTALFFVYKNDGGGLLTGVQTGCPAAV